MDAAFARYVMEEPYIYVGRMHLRDRQNPIEFYSEAEFLQRYRFSKRTVSDVLLPYVRSERLSNRGLPIPDILKLLIALRFYATGSFQLVCGDLAGVTQGTVCKIIKSISNDLVAVLPRHMKFPSSDEDTARCKRSFYEKGQFPGVVGCIDCTHVPIVSPGGEFGELYRNRKGWFSLNVQVVAGPSMEIMDIVCRWQGSAHDARIFHNSRLKLKFETNEVKGILLGDSGYPLLPYLFTPVLRPVSASERRYNISHIRTRCTVERTFWVWKRRFPCISMKLRVKLFTAQKVILACAVLRNVAMQNHDPMPDRMPAMPRLEVPVQRLQPVHGRPNAIRAAFIERHFGEEVNVLEPQNVA
ncbi:putative nuclease HARBI1 [Ischnura elegans]|nr:putative nuclease HARBI1 [Ischnura elegans]